MNIYLDWALTILYYASVPVTTLLNWVFYLLSPVWYLIYMILLPFGYLGHFIKAVVTYPLRYLGTLEVRLVSCSTL
jgi:hypothetical protein